MASISKRSSYVEFKVERAADVDVGSSDDEETVAANANTTATKKPKHLRWTCGLRRLSTSPTPSTPRRTELKVSFTVQFVHSFCLRTDPDADLETHNIPHGDETQLSVTLQDPRQQSGATWRKLIASALSGSVPGPLMDAVAWKLQRDLATLQVPPHSSSRRARAQAEAEAQARRGSRLLVLHVHVAVKVVTPDGVTAETLLDRISTPVVGEEGVEEDCVICFERLGAGRGSTLGLEVRRMVGCSHVFHGECLLRWVLKRASCPVCWSRCLALFLPRD